MTGWCSAKARTGPGIVAVGTNAERMKSRKIAGRRRRWRPARDVAVRPGITASQVRARVNSTRMPDLEPGQEAGSRPEPHQQSHQDDQHEGEEIGDQEVSTCAQRIDERAIGIDWKRSRMPPETSRKSRKAV